MKTNPILLAAAVPAAVILLTCMAFAPCSPEPSPVPQFTAIESQAVAAEPLAAPAPVMLPVMPIADVPALPEPSDPEGEFRAVGDYRDAELVVYGGESSYAPTVLRIDGAKFPTLSTVRVVWKTGEAKFMPSGDDLSIHIWAKPGTYEFQATLAVQTFREIQVWRPDPNDPGDITKAKLATETVMDDFALIPLTVTHTIPGKNPEPDTPDDPDEPDDPAPVEGLAGKVRELFKAMPDGVYDKATAEMIAGNFQSVASQGSDPARSTGWNLEAFRSATSRLNSERLGTAKLDQWGADFLGPLATLMSGEFSQRGLTVTDREGIATLWSDFADAISAAAY